MITHKSVRPSTLAPSHSRPLCHSRPPLSCPLTAVSLPLLLFVVILNHFQLQPPLAPDHSAPRSWHERDFCLRNLPASLSRGYRGTRLDRKRLAREVMLSRWPPPLRSSAFIPGGHGDWPLASRTAHSRSSGVR